MIDGNKVVLSVSNADTRVDDAEFEENEVYAIDIVTSSGEGKVMSSQDKIKMQYMCTILIYEASNSLNGICSLSCWMRSRQLFTRELLTRTTT